jgi:cytochrome oxidase Cu insertion factor (SCO1/SenC/PrrC family)
MTALAVAVGLLALLTLFNLFVLLGVIRRLRTIAASTGDPLADVLPAVGRAVGPFSLTSADGTTVTEADVAHGQSVVLVLSSGCSPCQATAAALAGRRTGLPARTFVFVQDDGDPKGPAMLANLAGVGTLATFGAEAGIEAAFGVGGYPTALLVEDGAIAAASTEYADVVPDRVSA